MGVYEFKVLKSGDGNSVQKEANLSNLSFFRNDFYPTKGTSSYFDFRLDGQTFPKRDQTVVIHYEGRIQGDEKGTPFDSSICRNVPFRFVLGKNQVIKGFEDNIKNMSIGQKIELTCPPEYAYGKCGYPGVIPSNATLIFEIELLGIE